MLGTFRRVSVVCALGAGLAACASGGDLAPPPPTGVAQYKIGQPYEVGGTWYYPKEQPQYDEEGIASWYGPTFYGHRTADGEIFNANAMTAAHPTLPMPVYVRVTDLDNGRSAILRVNDRGPYANNRIIDVSEHAAEVLGFKRAGTAHVRVQYIGRADNGVPPPAQDDDSETVVASNAIGGPPGGTDSGETAADAMEDARTAALNAAGTGGSVAVAPAMALPVPSTAEEPDHTVLDTSSASDPDSDQADSDPVPAASAPVSATSLAPATAESAPAPASLPPPHIEPQMPQQASLASTPAKTHLYIQAGAFSSRANANRLVSLLASIGSFFVSPVEKAGMELYRVRSGPFDDLAAANAALARVTSLGNNAARIVVDQ